MVRSAGVTILLTSKKTPPFDLGQLRSQGVEPETLSVIGVKAAVAHRRAYDRITKASFTVATPGPCSSDFCIAFRTNARSSADPLIRWTRSNRSDREISTCLIGYLPSSFWLHELAVSGSALIEHVDSETHCGRARSRV